VNFPNSFRLKNVCVMRAEHRLISSQPTRAPPAAPRFLEGEVLPWFEARKKLERLGRLLQPASRIARRTALYV
jgi:hypothetical protein